MEVKLDSRFYSGIGQAIALRELYSMEAVILHIMQHVDEKTERGPLELRIDQVKGNSSR